MDRLKEITLALSYIKNNSDIKFVDSSSSDLDVSMVKRLYDANLIDAIDASASDGLGYISPKINFEGLNYLEHLKKENKWYRSFNRRIAVWSLIVGLLSVIVGIINLP